MLENELRPKLFRLDTLSKLSDLEIEQAQLELDLRYSLNKLGIDNVVEIFLNVIDKYYEQN